MTKRAKIAWIVVGAVAAAGLAVATFQDQIFGSDDPKAPGTSASEPESPTSTPSPTPSDDVPSLPELDPNAPATPEAPATAEETPIARALFEENPGVESVAAAQELVELSRNDPQAFVDLVQSPGSGGMTLEVGADKTSSTRNLIVAAGVKCGINYVDAGELTSASNPCFSTADWALSTAYTRSQSAELRALDAVEIATARGELPADQTLDLVRTLG